MGDWQNASMVHPDWMIVYPAETTLRTHVREFDLPGEGAIEKKDGEECGTLLEDGGSNDG